MLQCFIFDCFVLFIVVYKALNTIVERILTDARHAVRNFNGGQAITILERISIDARHTGRYNDGGQVTTISECLITDFCNVGRNNDGG